MLGFMRAGLKFLAPNQKFQFLLTSMVENFEEKTKKSFKIKVTYQNSSEKPYEKHISSRPLRINRFRSIREAIDI